MAELPDFTKLVPGFEFLQGLVKNAGAAMPAIPGMSQWIAPTLDPEELDKRIGELKTVQFWLEQNARLLGTTIQAMEVQRMTLSTLKTMNVKMDDLRESMTAKVPSPSAFAQGTGGFPAAFASAFKFPAAGGGAAAETSDGASAAAPAPNPFVRTPPPAATGSTPSSAGVDAAALGSQDAGADTSTGTDPATPSAIDPMKWWGALTEQFATLAATAIKDGTTEAQRAMAGITAAAAKAARPPRAGRGSGTAATGTNAAKGSASAKGGSKPKPKSISKADDAPRAAAESPAKSTRAAASGTIRSTGSAAKSARAASPSSRRTTPR
jgi:hypothetical protein